MTDEELAKYAQYLNKQRNEDEEIFKQYQYHKEEKELMNRFTKLSRFFQTGQGKEILTSIIQNSFRSGLLVGLTWSSVKIRELKERSKNERENKQDTI